MAINYNLIDPAILPYPDFQNNQIMDDFLFDDNNKAILAKINELITRFNNLVTTLHANTDGDSGAQNIGITTISGVTAEDVQTALEALRADIVGIVNSGIPDGSITLDKLASTPLIIDNNIKQEDFAHIKRTWSSNTSPTSSANYTAGYKINDRWFDATSEISYICTGDGIWAAEDGLDSAIGAFFNLTEATSTIRNALQVLVHRYQTAVLPLDLFYNGTVDKRVGAFVYKYLNAVSGANLVGTLTTTNVTREIQPLFGVKPIYIDEYPSTAKLKITYTLVSPETKAAQLKFAIPSYEIYDRGSVNGILDCTPYAMSIPLTAGTNQVATFDLSTIAYLRGNGIPLWLNFPISTPFEGGTVTLTISRIQITAN